MSNTTTLEIDIITKMIYDQIGNTRSYWSAKDLAVKVIEALDLFRQEKNALTPDQDEEDCGCVETLPDADAEPYIPDTIAAGIERFVILPSGVVGIIFRDTPESAVDVGNARALMIRLVRAANLGLGWL